jgi:outer membrane lipoprotein-sorting protein
MNLFDSRKGASLAKALIIVAFALDSVFLLLASSTAATEPDVADVLRRMKAAMEPPRASLRTIDIVLTDESGARTEWLARQARRSSRDGNRILTVMLQPEALKGSAVLIEEREDGSNVQWVYLPSVRRVRKLMPVGQFQPFLGTDFTYADLGFISLDDRSTRVLGTEDRPTGGTAYKVEQIPRNEWHYSRIIAWIATDTLLPLQRDYYSPAGDLWKQQYFETVSVIEGVPTPLAIRMVNRAEGGSTELRIRNLDYDSEIPDDLFDPTSLPKLADHPIWAK